MRTSYCILSLAAAASALQLNSNACEGSDAEITMTLFWGDVEISVSSQEDLDKQVEEWFTDYVQKGSDSLSKGDLRRFWKNIVTYPAGEDDPAVLSAVEEDLRRGDTDGDDRLTLEEMKSIWIVPKLDGNLIKQDDASPFKGLDKKGGATLDAQVDAIYKEYAREDGMVGAPELYALYGDVSKDFVWRNEAMSSVITFLANITAWSRNVSMAVVSSRVLGFAPSTNVPKNE